MSATDPRWQAGKHLTLVEDRYLEYQANIPSHLVPPLSTWLELCEEGLQLVERGHLPAHNKDRALAIVNWLKHTLRLSVSVKGRGRAEMVQGIGASEQPKIPKDEGQISYGPQAQVQGKVPKPSSRGATGGLRDVAQR